MRISKKVGYPYEYFNSIERYQKFGKILRRKRLLQ